MKDKFLTTWKSRVEKSFSDDRESKLGVYKQINPDLQRYSTEESTPEFERIHITRFRTGSHKLQIEKGRHSRIPRENRLCICNTDIQTLNHVIFTCPLTSRIPNITNLYGFFSQNSNDITTSIQKFSKTLKIKIYWSLSTLFCNNSFHRTGLEFYCILLIRFYFVLFGTCQ